MCLAGHSSTTSSAWPASKKAEPAGATLQFINTAGQTGPCSAQLPTSPGNQGSHSSTHTAQLVHTINAISISPASTIYPTQRPRSRTSDAWPVGHIIRQIDNLNPPASSAGTWAACSNYQAITQCAQFNAPVTWQNSATITQSKNQHTGRLSARLLLCKRTHNQILCTAH